MKKIAVLFVLIFSLSAFAQDSVPASGVDVANLLSEPKVAEAFREYSREIQSVAYVFTEKYEDLTKYQFIGAPKTKEDGRVWTYLNVSISFGVDMSGKPGSIYQTSIERPILPR